MSQAGQISGEGAVLPVDVPLSFVTDDGIAIADNNILNVVGGDGISTSGSGNDITIDAEFEPNRVVTLVDDFFNQNGTGSAAPGQLMWFEIGTVATTAVTSNGHPGILLLGNSAASGITLLENTKYNLVLGGGEVALNFVTDLVTLSTPINRYTNIIGMTNDSNGSAITDGVYFSYNDSVNSGNWVLNCTAGSVTTSVNTAIPATTGFHNYQVVVNPAGTSASFFIDGVSAGASIAANIPTTALSPYFVSVRSAGALPASQIDLFYMKQTLTTAR